MNLQKCLKILELETTCSLEDAKRAYKDMVRVWHPDRFQSNPRLKQKAGQKLREINLAYTYLCRHLESNQTGELSPPNRTSGHPSSGVVRTAHTKSSAISGHGTDAPGMTGKNRQQSGTFAVPISKSVGRKSFIGRYVLLSFLFVFLAIVALVVYFLYHTDEMASRTRGLASEAVDKILEHLDKSQPADQKGPRARPLLDRLDRKVDPDDLQPRFEIHLDSGGIIMTEAWWEEGAMIMYRIEGGSMGIERTRVKKIVKR
jgi:hypothetical protein